MLVKSGYKVYGASRSGGKTYKNENSGGEFIPVVMDVNNEENIASVVERIIAENSRLDAVVCNAGNGIAGSAEDTSIEEARYQFETNFFGALKTIKACVPLFRAQGFGKIISVSSVAGVVPIPFQAFYSASKSAVIIFMQALSLELKPFNIQCCTILPGDTKTDFTAARKYTAASQSEQSAYFEKMNSSVGKMEKDEQNGMPPEKIASAIVNQINRKKMSVSVVPRIDYKLICMLFRILPKKFALWVVSLLY
jgi:short-subunit dehydrogenase